jgi:hypothetical protein
MWLKSQKMLAFCLQIIHPSQITIDSSLLQLYYSTHLVNFDVTLQRDGTVKERTFSLCVSGIGFQRNAQLYARTWFRIL